MFALFRVLLRHWFTCFLLPIGLLLGAYSFLSAHLDNTYEAKISFVVGVKNLEQTADFRANPSSAMLYPDYFTDVINGWLQTPTVVRTLLLALGEDDNGQYKFASVRKMERQTLALSVTVKTEEKALKARDILQNDIQNRVAQYNKENNTHIQLSNFESFIVQKTYPVKYIALGLFVVAFIFLFFFWVFFESLQGKIISHDELGQKARRANWSGRPVRFDGYDILARAQKSEKHKIIILATDERQAEPVLQMAETLASIVTTQQKDECVFVEGFMENVYALSEKTSTMTGWSDTTHIELKDCFLTEKGSYRILPQGTGKKCDALRSIELSDGTWIVTPLFSETDAAMLHALKNDALILIAYTLGRTQHATLDDICDMLQTSTGSDIFFTEVR